MATALLSIGLLVLFSIIGIMTFSFFDGERKGDLLFLAPAVGLSITTVLAVDCVALAPVRIMKYVVLGVFIVMLSVRGRKMLATAKNELKYKRFGSCCLCHFMYPSIDADGAGQYHKNE